MKKTIIQQIIAVVLPVVFLFAACTKEMSEVKLDSQVATTQSQNVTSSSATVTGFIVAEGIGIDEKGVCYNTSTAPTISNSKVAYSGSTASATYTVTLTGLNYATKYYARAYATLSDASTIYGEEFVFTTLPIIPVITTTSVTAITGSTALTGGNITVGGGADITARGVCYGTATPTISDTKTSDGTGSGVFTSSLTGLKGNTTYYIRAYATNSAGTGYGSVLSFSTPVDLPQVTTTAVSAITKTSAVSGGNVSYDGGSSVTSRGIVWGTSASPTLSDHKIEAGTGTGEFVSSLTGLSTYTTYHVRAYATNSAGTAYGSDLSFTTLANILTWYIPGDYVEASYPDAGLSNWSPANSPQIKSTLATPDNLEGYVYMANTSNQWKFATQANWDGPNYGGGSGTLDPSGDNITSSAGYYKINADASALKYTAVATVWGVIGEATANGWNDETALAYNSTARQWQGVVHLTAAEFKFRANHSWDYNYGSSTKDANLNAGGDNIAITVESDYSVSLDLSHPNAYTYVANRWGVIGDASPGGWDTDTNMSWDSVNKVFTVTLTMKSSGTFKFRANDGWDVNYGGSLSALTAGGDNLSVPSDGTYTVTFDPWNLKATLTKN
jgi:starch-binding outer membrane protein SusE/F